MLRDLAILAKAACKKQYGDMLCFVVCICFFFMIESLGMLDIHWVELLPFVKLN